MVNDLIAPMSDAQLLVQYLDNGCEFAFQELVERHGGMVQRVCMRQLAGDPDLADDAAQATFLLLADKGHELREHTCLAAWLATSARFQAANLRRKEQRRVGYELQAGQHINATRPFREQGPDRHAEQSEIRQHIDDALATLPEKTRSAVILHHLEGHPQRDVASMLGCNVEAVKKRIQYGVRKLRERLPHRELALASLLAILSDEASAAESVHMVVKAPAGNVGVASSSISMWSWAGMSSLAASALAMVALQQQEPVQSVQGAPVSQAAVPLQQEASSGEAGLMGPFVWSRALDDGERAEVLTQGDSCDLYLFGYAKSGVKESGDIGVLRPRNNVLAQETHLGFAMQMKELLLHTPGAHNQEVCMGYVGGDAPTAFSHGDDSDLMHEAGAPRILVLLPMSHGHFADYTNQSAYRLVGDKRAQHPRVIQLDAGENYNQNNVNEDQILADLGGMLEQFKGRSFVYEQAMFSFDIGEGGAWSFKWELDGRDGLAGGARDGWDGEITHESAGSRRYDVPVDAKQSYWALSSVAPGGKPYGPGEMSVRLHAYDRSSGEPVLLAPEQDVVEEYRFAQLNDQLERRAKPTKTIPWSAN